MPKLSPPKPCRTGRSSQHSLGDTHDPNKPTPPGEQDKELHNTLSNSNCSVTLPSNVRRRWPADPSGPTGGLPKGRYVLAKPGPGPSMPLEEIDTKGMNDKNFIDKLRSVYLRRLSICKTYFSIMRFHHWGHDEYSFFEKRVYSTSDGSGSRSYLPRAPYELDYEFSRNGDKSPLIPQTLFWCHYYSRPSKLSLVRSIFRRNYNKSRDNEALVPPSNEYGTKLLDVIPKRRHKWNSDYSFQFAWGMTAFELPSFLGFIIYCGLCFVVPAAFWALWLSVMGHDADIQNASIPAVFVLSLWIGVYQMADGPRWNRCIDY
ncbi:hypothetical protein F5Y04DRAFT_128995 [Hypomontagnella monticulosa]|nr:hypothetical protein F5Y04DRAFT_128995 [Hypomontagnella monticulosa]